MNTPQKRIQEFLIFLCVSVSLWWVWFNAQEKEKPQ
jgi:hypothetical protein